MDPIVEQWTMSRTRVVIRLHETLSDFYQKDGISVNARIVEAVVVEESRPTLKAVVVINFVSLPFRHRVPSHGESNGPDVIRIGNDQPVPCTNFRWCLVLVVHQWQCTGKDFRFRIDEQVLEERPCTMITHRMQIGRSEMRICRCYHVRRFLFGPSENVI